jgi:hypothetical protein
VLARRLAPLVTLAMIAAPRLARADLPKVTNRAFAIDLYDGVAIGSTRAVSMGGAAAALADGSSGVPVNVSAPAVRPTTDADPWSLDGYVDGLTSSLSSDFANTGLPDGNSGASLLSAGFGLRVGDYAGALVTTIESTALASNNGGLRANTLRTELAFARWLPHLELAVGIAIENVAFELTNSVIGPETITASTLTTIDGLAAATGATWIPRLRNVRIGGNVTSPTLGGTVSSSSCVTACKDFILPDRIAVPWQVVVGGAYRFGPTPWNQIVPWHYRDERVLTLAVDGLVTGAATDAFGLQAFGQQLLQRSGRHVAFSLRGGAEYELFPGRLRVRAGSYWDPARLVETSGRIHGTFGLEVATFQLNIFGPRRFELAATGDVAAGYESLGVSIGFWH